MTIVHDTFTIERTYDTSVTRLYEAWADPKLEDQVVLRREMSGPSSSARATSGSAAST